ncbi:MAG TPA: hypothetical protein VMY99_02735 [Nevskiaceae bacterium]|nr:hypothetical protein [Nevskiaceae bacterium]
MPRLLQDKSYTIADPVALAKGLAARGELAQVEVGLGNFASNQDNLRTILEGGIESTVHGQILRSVAVGMKERKKTTARYRCR